MQNLNKITDAIGTDCAFLDIGISLQIFDTLKKESSMDRSIFLFITIVITLYAEMRSLYLLRLWI